MMSEISDEQLTDFCGKLNDFRESLESAEQKSLLDAILKIAWSKTASAESLDQEFDGCFEPGEAAAILQYSAGEVDMISGMIRGNMIRGTAGDMIRGGPSPLHGFIK
jgi:hypothetical protein